MTKRKISLVLVLSILLSLMIPTLALGAVDYAGHWAEDTIQEWFDNEMILGYEDGSFKPNEQITRAEFMTMVNSAFDFTEKAKIGFTDVNEDDWFYDEVQVAVKAGYLIGYEDNTARPDSKITRQEAALIIARIKDLDNYATGAAIFNDVAEIVKWAIGGVGAVADEGYMIGYEDVTFRPLKIISRAEAVVTIDRAMEKEEVEEEPSTGGDRDTSGPSTPTRTYAVLNELHYTDGTTSSAITGSAIETKEFEFETTSSSVTITAITATTSSAIDVKMTTGSAIVTTHSSITSDGSFIINVTNIDADVTLTITVSDTSKNRDTVYTVTIKKK